MQLDLLHVRSVPRHWIKRVDGKEKNLFKGLVCAAQKVLDWQTFLAAALIEVINVKFEEKKFEEHFKSREHYNFICTM